ncbi:MAG: hybrid sensor histidine kinase/response regulator [Candidatus Anammoxibacter sp.]
MDNGKKQTVLVVDDSAPNIFVLEGVLNEDYNVLVAKDGGSALSIIEKDRPDLILLDIMMPGMDGLEVCSKLKNNKKTKDIPIIFITSKTETEDVVKGFKIGAVDYITKPFKRGEVYARVRTHLQLVNAQKQLKIQNQRLVELDKLKNNFVGMAAHDLRNPLTSICMLTQLIIKEVEDLSLSEVDEKLIMIRNSSKRMIALINNLLDVTVIESGKLELNIRPYSMKELIQERIKMFKIDAKRKKIRIHALLNEIENVLFDHNYITQVIDNLITNALKFSESDKNVYVTLDKNISGAKISVRDEGPGISEEDQAKLYGTFQKLSARPTGDEKSTGLGLAIVKKVIEAHRGELNVESQLGKGTTFSFTLPVS